MTLDQQTLIFMYITWWMHKRLLYNRRFLQSWSDGRTDFKRSLICKVFGIKFSKLKVCSMFNFVSSRDVFNTFPFSCLVFLKVCRTRRWDRRQSTTNQMMSVALRVQACLEWLKHTGLHCYCQTKLQTNLGIWISLAFNPGHIWGYLSNF